jgi:hypothetical protein
MSLLRVSCRQYIPLATVQRIDFDGDDRAVTLHLVGGEKHRSAISEDVAAIRRQCQELSIGSTVFVPHLPPLPWAEPTFVRASSLGAPEEEPSTAAAAATADPPEAETGTDTESEPEAGTEADAETKAAPKVRKRAR